jgi:hypothetical protein
MTQANKRRQKLMTLPALVLLLSVFIGAFWLTSYDDHLVAAISNLNNTLMYQREREIDEIVFTLEKSPLWTRLEKNTDEEKSLLNALEKISQYKVEIIREAAIKYLKNNSKNLYEVIGVESRVFVLNRYLFKVPENAPFDNGTFGGWGGVPVRNKEINWLWPLAYRPDGQLYIEGKYKGYSGHPYQAIEEFDYFYKTYGLRKKSN